MMNMEIEELFKQLKRAVEQNIAFVGIQKQFDYGNNMPMVVITFPQEVELEAVRRLYTEISDNYRGLYLLFVNLEEYPRHTIRLFLTYVSPEIREQFQVITEPGPRAWFS
jgi:hypothetical protein